MIVIRGLIRCLFWECSVHKKFENGSIYVNHSYQLINRNEHVQQKKNEQKEKPLQQTVSSHDHTGFFMNFNCLRLSSLVTLISILFHVCIE